MRAMLAESPLSVDSRKCLEERNWSDNFWLTIMISPMVQKVLVVIRRKYVTATGAGRWNTGICDAPHHGSTARTKSQTALKTNTYFKNLAGRVCLQLPRATVMAEAREIMEHEKEMRVRRANILSSTNTK